MPIAYPTSVLLLVLLVGLAVGSLLNLSRSPHWFVRGWDFPRVQIVVIGWLLAACYVLTRMLAGDDEVVRAWPYGTIAVGLTLWHGFRILPYTPLLATQSASTPPDEADSHREDNRTIRMVMSNVEMENNQYETWVQTMRAVDPDVLLLLEIDQMWVDAITEFTAAYPHQIVEPQNNWFGMMMLSRLPIVEYKVRHLVQDDVPSIDAVLRLDDESTIRFVGVHPRPPEPLRGNHATARDAELTLWGEELSEEDGPIIIGGDLNDVAWSQMTRLFLRTSGLLDPRRGRGFFNTFHVDHPYMRFPLDHIFHSKHFTISQIKRLSGVGSDHFPILIDLRHAPSTKTAHQTLTEKSDDQDEVDVRVDRAASDPCLHGEAVDGGEHEKTVGVDQNETTARSR